MMNHQFNYYQNYENIEAAFSSCSHTNPKRNRENNEEGYSNEKNSSLNIKLILFGDIHKKIKILKLLILICLKSKYS